MATLERRQNRYRIVLRLYGRKFSRSIRTANEIEAQAALARIKDSLRRIELGILTPPDGVDVVTFLFSDGRIENPVQAPRVRSLQQLSDNFFDSRIEGAVEDTTLSCTKIHLSHFKRILGSRFLIAEIQQKDLCRYVKNRLKEKGRRGGKVSPVTIRKELTSFRTVWNWATEERLVQRPLPLRGLKLGDSLRSYDKESFTYGVTSGKTFAVVQSQTTGRTLGVTESDTDGTTDGTSDNSVKSRSTSHSRRGGRTRGSSTSESQASSHSTSTSHTRGSSAQDSESKASGTNEGSSDTTSESRSQSKELRQEAAV